MKLLFIGDIVGEPGRRAVKRLVPVLRERHGLQFVIANGENSAGGAGITTNTARDIFDAGVDVITTGDHLWDQREINQLLEHEPRLLRPANYPAGVVGRGSVVICKPGLPPVAVLDLQGRTFMAPLENPFTVAAAEVEKLRAQTPIIFVDIHAEATSEKIALGWFLDGKVSAVVGTHTHVQTADERILPGGTACLTDAGFTGGHGGVLGREWPPIVERFCQQTPQKFGVCETDVKLHGCVVDIDEDTGKARSIVRVSEPLPAE
ncbi:MAG TPA: TIGR00282 family metallophosphoesterase [Candidatus Limnocylindria bacterium]|nr:TIGR00282 family metallophosphoesterase [Candidatus Limnocylindria bacterium]